MPRSTRSKSNASGGGPTVTAKRRIGLNAEQLEACCTHTNEETGETHVYSFMEGARAMVMTGPINFLLPCVLIAFISQGLDWPSGVTFAFAIVGIAPFAERLGYVTEQLAIHTNETIGGLLNATFGNATELIVAISALANGLYRLVQLSLLGSILSNVLLVLGCSFWIGGSKYKTLNFSNVSSQVNCSLLSLGVMGVLFPTILTWTNAETIKGEIGFSRAAAILLFSTYVAFLYFQIITHPHAYDEVEVEKDDNEKNNGVSDHELLVHEVSLLRAALEGKLKNRQSPQAKETDAENGFRSPRMTNTPEASARARRHWSNAAATMQSNLYKAQKQNIHRNAAANADLGDRDNDDNDDDDDDDDDDFSESAETRQNSRANQRSSNGNGNARVNARRDKNGDRERDNGSANDDKIRNNKAARNNHNSPSYVIDRRKNLGLNNGGVIMSSPGDTVMATPHSHMGLDLDGLDLEENDEEDEEEEEEEEEDVLGFWYSIVWLTIITVFISFLSDALVAASIEVALSTHPLNTSQHTLPSSTLSSSDALVASIEVASTDWHVTGVFLSTIVIPIIGNAAEHASSITAAYKNKCDLTLGIAVGSSTQICLCVMPLLIIIAWGMDRPLTMNFEPFEAFTLFTSVFILSICISHGQATWIMGVALCCAYLLVSVGFFVHFDQDLGSH